MGLSADNNPGGQSGQDSIICLVHRLGIGRPAEQAALGPGPVGPPISRAVGGGSHGQVVPGLCKPPDPAAHWSRRGLPIPLSSPIQ